MSYFIYENWQAGPHKTVLHVDVCPFCNNGKGLTGGTDSRHGKWHGPFATLGGAERAQHVLATPVSKQHSCIRSAK